MRGGSIAMWRWMGHDMRVETWTSFGGQEFVLDRDLSQDVSGSWQ